VTSDDRDAGCSEEAKRRQESNRDRIFKPLHHAGMVLPRSDKQHQCTDRRDQTRVPRLAPGDSEEGKHHRDDERKCQEIDGSQGLVALREGSANAALTCGYVLPRHQTTDHRALPTGAAHSSASNWLRIAAKSQSRGLLGSGAPCHRTRLGQCSRRSVVFLHPDKNPDQDKTRAPPEKPTPDASGDELHGVRAV